MVLREVSPRDAVGGRSLGRRRAQSWRFWVIRERVQGAERQTWRQGAACLPRAANPHLI